MTRTTLLFVPVLLVASAASALADEPANDFIPLFNGRDLSSWVNVNGHPDTFSFRGDTLVANSKSSGFIRTSRHYENFVVEFDWRLAKGATPLNPSFFIWCNAMPSVVSSPRGVCIHTAYKVPGEKNVSYGDISLAGDMKGRADSPAPKRPTHCSPSEQCARPDGEWNHYAIVANKGTVKLSVNGKEVSGFRDCSIRKGYLAFASSQRDCEFRNICIKELPADELKKQEVASIDVGYTHLALNRPVWGFRVSPGEERHWSTTELLALRYDGRGTGGSIWSGLEYGDFQLIMECALPGGKGNTDLGSAWALTIGADTLRYEPKGIAARGDGWTRFLFSLKGDELSVVVNGKRLPDKVSLKGLPARHRIGLFVKDKPITFGGIFVRDATRLNTAVDLPAKKAEPRLSSEYREALKALSGWYDLDGQRIHENDEVDQRKLLGLVESRDPKVREFAGVAHKMLMIHNLWVEQGVEVREAIRKQSEGMWKALANQFIQSLGNSDPDADKLKGAVRLVEEFMGTAPDSPRGKDGPAPQKKINARLATSCIGRALSRAVCARVRELTEKGVAAELDAKDLIHAELLTGRSGLGLVAITNRSRHTLHNCIILTRLAADREAVEKAGKEEAVINGLVLPAIGFSGTTKAERLKMTDLRVLCAMQDTEGIVFVPVIPAGATVLTQVTDAGIFGLTKGADISVFSQQFPACG